MSGQPLQYQSIDKSQYEDEEQIEEDLDDDDEDDES